MQSDVSIFSRLHAGSTGDAQSLRQAGMRRFEAVGLPRMNEEEWRFTDTQPLAEVDWQLPERTPQAADLRAAHTMPGAVEITLCNGRLASSPDPLPKGLYVGLLSQAPAEVAARARTLLGSAAPVNLSAFVALNSAFLEDVIVIHVAKGAAIDPVVHLLSLASSEGAPLLFSPRVLVIAEADSILRIVETHVGDAPDEVFSNTVVEIFAGPGSVVDHYQAQWNAPRTTAMQSTTAILQSAATYSHHHASLSGKLIRNDLQVILDGERADATINGVVLLDGDRHVDNHTLIRHEKPNCTSHELYKHVVAGEARCVFKGKIFVQKDAQHTDSKQTSRTLLLSDRAFMESMPALEIYADDVKCMHGSTIGPLDGQMLFYLRSRGLSADAAQHLLIYAFAADITARMKAKAVRKRIESYIAQQQNLPQDLSIEAT